MNEVKPLVERLMRSVDAARDEDERGATFVRGLVIGALVGAAIAGSTLLQRRRARSNEALPAPETVPPDAPPDAPPDPRT